MVGQGDCGGIIHPGLNAYTVLDKVKYFLLNLKQQQIRASKSLATGPATSPHVYQKIIHAKNFNTSL